MDRAKALLKEIHTYTCVFVCGEEVRTSELSGVRPLMGLVNSDEDLKGWSAADRVVGRAAALLYVYLGVAEVFAQVLSKSAEEVFLAHKILYSCDILTEGIINRTGDGLCPMEQATKGIFDPEEGMNAIRTKLKELASNKN